MCTHMHVHTHTYSASHDHGQGFLKDKGIGSKRLASMPDRFTNTINAADGRIICRPSVINNYGVEMRDLQSWFEQWFHFMFQSEVCVKSKQGVDSIVCRGDGLETGAGKSNCSSDLGVFRPRPRRPPRELSGSWVERMSRGILKVEPNSANIEQTSIKTALMSSNLLDLGQIWLIWAKRGRDLTMFAPISTLFGPTSTKLGPNSANFGLHSSKLWPNSRDVEQV